MTDAEYEARTKEIDRLLNDPSTPFDSSRVWSLLSELTSVDAIRVTRDEGESAHGPSLNGNQQ